MYESLKPICISFGIRNSVFNEVRTLKRKDTSKKKRSSQNSCCREESSYQSTVRNVESHQGRAGGHGAPRADRARRGVKATGCQRGTKCQVERQIVLVTAHDAQEVQA